MCIAAREALRMQQEELHFYERPHALHMQMVANLNRDPKKGRAYKIDDFCLYMSQEKRNLPDGKYGAAALNLISKGMFPFWALFCYKELKTTAQTAATPSLLCFQSESAILLAPEQSQAGFTGLLIALEEAGDCRQELVSPCGKKLVTVIPPINTKFIAKEDVTLPILSYQA